MSNIAVTECPFHEGDEVVLSMGSHPGTLGVFLRLKKDVKWAEIRERNGDVCSHPVVWLAHAPKAAPVPRIDTL